jgi:S-adenosylmethionine hydrolase
VSILTLTTDFGLGSPYVAQMKGVILSINPAAMLIDISHAIRPQDVRQGAIVLDDVTDKFPSGTIHVAVVDPGVGTDRAILYAEIGSQRYICPDNGLLSRIVERERPTRLVQITNDAYWRKPVSSTFHGRDIMAPVAAHLSLGLDPARLGPPASRVSPLAWPKPVVKPRRIEGEVIEIDSFGNLATNITDDLVVGRPVDERACIVCSIYETFGIYSTYAEQLPGMLVALVDSTGRLELALVGDSAADRLGIRVGMPVVVAWD